MTERTRGFFIGFGVAFIMIGLAGLQWQLHGASVPEPPTVIMHECPPCECACTCLLQPIGD